MPLIGHPFHSIQIFTQAPTTQGRFGLGDKTALIADRNPYPFIPHI
jgi:hypothetical protein